MRNLHLLDAYRIRNNPYFGWDGDDKVGAFIIASPIDLKPINIVATSGEGWDHVSASRETRCPNWPEMEHVKRTFFLDTETVMQLHVPVADHINFHPFCLHLWRPLTAEIPRPPAWMVGPKIERVHA